jgi:hypothetical protein
VKSHNTADYGSADWLYVGSFACPVPSDRIEKFFTVLPELHFPGTVHTPSPEASQA